MKDWLQQLVLKKMVITGLASSFLSFLYFYYVPGSSVWHYSQWNADWVQAIVSLLAVVVALFLPFFMEKKRREVEEEKLVKEELDQQKKLYDEETAVLIQIYHQVEMLSKFFGLSRQAFKSKNAQFLMALAFKNPGAYPIYFLDERNDLISISERLIGNNLLNFAQAVGAGREVAFDVVKMTEKLVLDKSVDILQYQAVLNKTDPLIFKYVLSNISKGEDACNKLKVECKDRKKKLS
jgi:hypothetical protein